MNFGAVVDGEMRLNEWGQIVTSCWHDLPTHYLHIELDVFVVMPNHVHGVVIITDAGTPEVTPHAHVGAGFKPAPTVDGRVTEDIPVRHGLPEIVRAFKTFSARRVNRLRNTPGTPLWQRNYYEHIIRNDRSLIEIREYILNNPAVWDRDPERM